MGITLIPYLFHLHFQPKCQFKGNLVILAALLWFSRMSESPKPFPHPCGCYPLGHVDTFLVRRRTHKRAFGNPLCIFTVYIFLEKLQQLGCKSVNLVKFQETYSCQWMLSRAAASDSLVHDVLGAAPSTCHLTHWAGMTQDPDFRIEIIIRHFSDHGSFSVVGNSLTWKPLQLLWIF